MIAALVSLAEWSGRHTALTGLLSVALMTASWRLHRASRLIDEVIGVQQ